MKTIEAIIRACRRVAAVPALAVLAACAAPQMESQSGQNFVMAVHPNGFDAAQPIVPLSNFSAGAGNCEVYHFDQCVECTSAALETYALNVLLTDAGQWLNDPAALTPERQQVAYDFRPADAPDMNVSEPLRAQVCLPESAKREND